jgi:hypothetical protein
MAVKGLRIPLAVVVAVGLGSAACGGSSKSTTATSRSTPTSRSNPTSVTSPPSTSTAPTGVSSSVTTGPLRATLTGANHAPTAGKSWSYSVVVTDPSGHGLSGTVDIEFTFGGVVVGHDTPPTHPVTNGRWHDTLTFPNTAVGHPLGFQAVVHTSQGSVTLVWPIKVQLAR